MKQLADGVWQLGGFPPNAINVYLIEDVLIDAATRYEGGRILKQLRGRPVAAHALTHAHPDHQGASHRVCTELSIPFWVGAGDDDAASRSGADRRAPAQPPHHPVLRQDLHRSRATPSIASCARATRSPGSRCSPRPGHSAGHVAFWRESDRVLVAGDVLNTADSLTLIPGLREPKRFFTPDPERNRLSLKRLGELEPRLVLVGHGPPYRDTKKFVEFCASA